MGLIINNQSSWHQNSENIVKRANTKMIILHHLCKFNVPVEEMLNIYILIIRSMLEYCSVVWHSSITEEENRNIECVQKTALRITFGEDYLDYSNALKMTGLPTLKERRTQLFEICSKLLKNWKRAYLFPLNPKTVNTRPHEKYFITPAHTDRLATSTVPYLQRLLNKQ